MLRVLLVPWGSGNGHLMRFLALARGADRERLEICIATTNAAERNLVLEHNFIPIHFVDGAPVGTGCWDGWDDYARVGTSLEGDRKLLQDAKADLVIHDGRPTIPIAAWRAGIRCASVLQSIHWPIHRYRGREREAIWTTSIPSFNRVLTELGAHRQLEDLRELICTHPAFIPSFPAFDSLRRDVSVESYVGPLTGVDGSMPHGRETSEDRAGIIIYKVLSGASDLAAFREAFDNLEADIRIAAGSEDEARWLADRLDPSLFRVKNMWGSADLAASNVAVTHGGHGIALTMLQLGIPSVVLPGGSPERRENGRNLEEMGAGLIVGDLDDVDLSWSAHDSSRAEIDWHTVRAAVDELMSDSRYGHSAEEAARELRQYTVSDTLNRITASASIPNL